MTHCQKCKKQGHQTQECWTKITKTSKFEGNGYNYQKYGHRAFECRSKSTWSSRKIRRYVNSYKWDYNTRYNYHYCQEYGHILENCIRTHFKGNYSRWLSQITCFSCHKTGHVRNNFPIMSKAPKTKFDKGKTEVENLRNEMNKIWKKKGTKSISNEKGITLLNESSGHTSSN